MKIDSFTGEWRCFSNFWFATVYLDGVAFPTVEHAYQAAKTLDPVARRSIHAARAPGVAKRMGQTVRLRPDWDAVKVEVMTDLVRQKFMRDFSLRQQLLRTGDAELVEGNNWGDTFWGVCNGVGQNHLGYILMQIRTECR